MTKKTVKKPTKRLGVSPALAVEKRRRASMKEKVPKTLFAAVDPRGRVRFTHEVEATLKGWVGKLSKFYSVEAYDLRVAGKVAGKSKIAGKSKEKSK